MSEQFGWKCQCCKAVLSPSVMVCLYCNPQYQFGTAGGTKGHVCPGASIQHSDNQHTPRCTTGGCKP